MGPTRKGIWCYFIAKKLFKEARNGCRAIYPKQYITFAKTPHLARRLYPFENAEVTNNPSQQQTQSQVPIHSSWFVQSVTNL